MITPHYVALASVILGAVGTVLVSRLSEVVPNQVITSADNPWHVVTKDEFLWGREHDH